MGGALVFRFDDIGASDRTAFHLIDLMETLEHPYLLGVIPDALGWRMKRRLRATRHAAVFQHGANHKNHALPEAPDEFPADYGRIKIAAGLRRGRRMLEDALGVAVTGYIPPWNRVSPVALRVLEDEGYRTLSADAIHATTLRQIPAQVDVYSQYDPVIVRAVEEIERDIAENLARTELVGVALHPMSLPRPALAGLCEMLANNRHRMLTDPEWERP